MTCDDLLTAYENSKKVDMKTMQEPVVSTQAQQAHKGDFTVFQAIARKSALALSLTLLAAPMGNLYAQPKATPTPSAVSGGDPQPTGEPDCVHTIFLLLSVLSSAFVS